MAFALSLFPQMASQKPSLLFLAIQLFFTDLQMQRGINFLVALPHKEVIYTQTLILLIKNYWLKKVPARVGREQGSAYTIAVFTTMFSKVWGSSYFKSLSFVCSVAHDEIGHWFIMA